MTEKSVYVRKTSGLTRSISSTDALLSNLVGMGIVVNIFWIVFASATYPGADLTATVFTALIVNLLIAYVYWMLATAMPRTGGDYVFVGRLLHPALGFMVNATFVYLIISWPGLFSQYTVAQGFQMMFANLGIVTGNTGYLDLAGRLASDQSLQFGLGSGLLLLVVLVMLLPTKWIFRIVVAIFAIQAVIYLWFIGALLGTSQATFVANFNSIAGQMFGGTSFDKIISDAAGPFPFTPEQTAIGLVYTMLSYIGYANSAYFAGEIRGNPQKAQGLAIFAAPIIFAALIYVLYYSIYAVFSHNFIVAASALAVGNPSKYPLPSLPSPAFLVVFISKDPLFTTLVPFSLALTFMGFAIVYFFIPVRNLFAWSFDRIVPTKFAEVNKRGVPYVAVVFYGIIAWIALYLTIYTPVFAFLAYANFGWWIAVAIVMIAGAILPWRRKDIFKSSPKIVQTKVGGFPVITIVAIAGFFASLWVSYSTITPSFLAGSPLSPVLVAQVMFVMPIALVIYAISYTINKRRGIPVELAMKELPPV